MVILVYGIYIFLVLINLQALRQIFEYIANILYLPLQPPAKLWINPVPSLTQLKINF
jgi:hypothetical protein